jgi:hypothetical protein
MRDRGDRIINAMDRDHGGYKQSTQITIIDQFS